MQIRLVALDIGGTLLDSKGTIPEANRQAITLTKEQGVKVVLATAMSFLLARSYAQMLGLDDPLVCVNGALIKSLQGQAWWRRDIESGLAREIAAWADVEGHSLVWLAEDCDYYVRSDRPLAWKRPPYARVVDSNAAALISPPLCIMAPNDDVAWIFLERFEDRTRGKLRFERYEDGGRLFTVAAVDAQASKQSALAHLCSRWGLSAQQVMAMGDGAADVGMLNWAGIGIAMGNAPSVMVRRAEFVAPSNDESGVAWAIRQFVLDRKGNDDDNTGDLSPVAD